MSRPAILIVEHQPIFGLVASDILRESGFDTIHACDADDAAALLCKHPQIGVVVADAELPGPITGLELAHKLCQIRPNVQLVVTSSRNDLEAKDVPPGARVLRKPYASGELRTAVAAKQLLQDA